jgi:hypothetical protein
MQPPASRPRSRRAALESASSSEIEQRSIDVCRAALEAAGNRRIIVLTHQLRERHLLGTKDMVIEAVRECALASEGRHTGWR